MRRRRCRLPSGRLHLGMVADIKSERWPASRRNGWPASVGIRTPAHAQSQPRSAGRAPGRVRRSGSSPKAPKPRRPATPGGREGRGGSEREMKLTSRCQYQSWETPTWGVRSSCKSIDDTKKLSLPLQPIPLCDLEAGFSIVTRMLWRQRCAGILVSERGWCGSST
jgi:hypothetical protein